MLREGERVQICVSTNRIVAGSVGTLIRVFISAPKTYEVQFDMYPEPYLVFGDVLELVADGRERVAGE